MVGLVCNQSYQEHPMEDLEEFLDKENVTDEAESEPRQARFFSISSYGADYTIDSLVKRVSRGDFYVPPFQRAFVWTIKQSSRFIESMLMGLPVPGIFVFREAESNRHLIIDGQQRLKSIEFFYKGIFADKIPFRLSEVQSKWQGRSYLELDEADRRRLDDSIIHTTIFKQDSPDDISSVYEVFERINTGGVKLSSQEIRACVSHGQLQGLLHEINSDENWRKIYGRPSARLKDQELILRFLAFKYDMKNYKRPMKLFLNNFMADNQRISDSLAREWKGAFLDTMSLIQMQLGRAAFRPERALNAAVYDAASVAISNLSDEGNLCSSADFETRYNNLITNATFSTLYKQSTADEDNVATRFKLARDVFHK